ncbi:MAG TPA: hypothetical protein VKV26_17395 [Dehalococcoidia bacterium]|nr:hypothetical protein [Dehalococcoidia bacterium]
MNDENTAGARAGARPGAEPAWTVEDARRVDFARIEPGWSVASADGEELGPVQGKGRDYLVVPYGREQERRLFVPREYIETIGERRVILNQPAQLLMDMKLDAPPAGFPEEHERVSGMPHEPLRMETGVVPEVDPLAGGAAQRGAPLRRPPERARSKAFARTDRAAAVAPTPNDSFASGRLTAADAAVQLAQSRRDLRGGAVRVEPTLDGRSISSAEGADAAAPRPPAATHMERAAGGRGSSQRPTLVNAEIRAESSFEERSGYRVLSSSAQFDRVGGPTHQPGVKDPRSLEPLRTQFGKMGTPGEGQERNVSDLDLTRNKRPDGDPFGSQAQTVGRPLAPGEPQAAQRSLPGPAGSSRARTGVKDVPPGSVARPRPDR